MTLGQKIRKARMMHHWSQEDLAEAIHVYQYQVSNWEADKVTPRIELLKELAEALGESIDALVREEVDI